MNRTDCKSIVARNPSCGLPEFLGCGLPGANGDINTRIIILCDSRTLMCLKGVSSEFNNFLSNGCFEIIFNIQHPHLVPYKHIFSNLRSSNPDKCWMIACCYFSERSKQLPSHLYQEGAKPLELELELQSKGLEMQIKKICGSGRYDQDPNSALSKALQADLEHNRLCEHIWSSCMQQINKSYADITLRDCVNTIFGLNMLIGCEMMWAGFRDSNFLKQKLHELESTQSLVLCDLHFLKIFSTAKFYDSNAYECQFFSQPIYYSASGEKRLGGLAYVELYNIHLQPLIEEHYEVVELEDACMHHLRLQNCVALIQNINDGFEDATSNTLACIAETINALPYRWKAHVWQALYNQCAQGMNEDRWSENHFPEYLPELEFILNEIIKDFHHRLLNSLFKEYA